MPDRTIPQRELRNNIGAVLRDAEAGDTIVVTVRGRPVAQLGPVDEPGPKTDVEWERVRRIFEIPIDSDRLAAELDAAEAPVTGPGV